MELFTPEVIPFICLPFLYATSRFKSKSENHEEKEQESCPICFESFSSEGSSYENLGKKIAFHQSKFNSKKPLKPHEMHFFHKDCLENWCIKLAISSENALCPLCRQSKIVFTLEDKLALYCEVNEIPKNIEKDLSLIISGVSKKVFEKCVSKCLFKCYWDRIYMIYQNIKISETRKFLIQALLKTIEKVSAKSILDIFYSCFFPIHDILKENSVFDAAFLILLDKLDLKFEVFPYDEMNPLHEEFLIFLIDANQFQRDLMEYFAKAKVDKRANRERKRLFLILLKFIIRTFIDLEQQKSNRPGIECQEITVSPILSLFLFFLMDFEFKLYDFTVKMFSQCRIQTLNSLSQLEKLDLVANDNFYLFYEFKAFFEILHSKELYERMLLFKQNAQISIESLPIVTYYIEDEYLHLFTDMATFSKLEFEELQKISTKNWYRYLFRQTVDYFSQDSVVQATGGIRNFAFNDSICKITPLKRMIDVFRKNLFFPLENLYLSRFNCFLKEKILILIFCFCASYGGLKNLRLDFVFLGRMEHESFIKMIRTNSKTLISIEMNNVGGQQIDHSYPFEIIEIENVKSISILSCSNLFNEFVRFKLHSNYESICLDNSYLNIFEENEQEYFSLRRFNAEEEFQSLHDENFRKLVQFLERNQKLAKLHLLQLFKFREKHQKEMVKHAFEKLSILKSICIDFVENFGDYVSEGLQIENLSIEHWLCFNGNWKPLQELKKLKTLSIKEEFELNDSFFEFIKRSTVENLYVHERMCEKVEEFLGNLPENPERSINLYSSRFSDEWTDRNKLFAIVKTKRQNSGT